MRALGADDDVDDGGDVCLDENFFLRSVLAHRHRHTRTNLPSLFRPLFGCLATKPPCLLR